MRPIHRTTRTLFGLALLAALFGALRAPCVADPVPDFSQFDCGMRGLDYWVDEISKGVERGEIADPRTRALPELPAAPQQVGLPQQCLTGEHIFAFEDTDSVLLTNYSNAQLVDLMVEASNALLAARGDIFDFIGFWVNFNPDHLLGTAFYKLVSNDVLGIGDVGEVIGQGATFDIHDDLGLAGETVQGMIVMWNINNPTWQTGDAPNAAFTRLALGQEFEHRFGLFLPPLLDGRVMQGDNASCGRIYHWNWQLDGQGSAMEISEWVGSSPAELVGNFVTFNTDIPGSIFSYSDLYLMGYVSPAEMDAGNSELRFMDTSDCTPVYNGTISNVTSADIIASAGPRVPDHTTARQDYRTGWIMIHLPGDPPDAAELDKAVGILDQHMDDWSYSTLDRGTMDNTLFADCNCNGVPDTEDCECQGDLDGSGDIGVGDFLLVIGLWGTQSVGPPDLNGDGEVGIEEFLIVLGNWGDCGP